MLTIFKGDDTGGTFGRPLHFTINTGADVDLAGCRAEFEFDGFVKGFENIVAGDAVEIVFTHEETASMKTGVRFAKFRIIDADGKIRTFDNSLAVKVTTHVGDAYPGSDSASITIGSGISWNQVVNKPDLSSIQDLNPDTSSLGDVMRAVNRLVSVFRACVAVAILAIPSFADEVPAKYAALKDLPGRTLIMTNVAEYVAESSGTDGVAVTNIVEGIVGPRLGQKVDNEHLHHIRNLVGAKAEFDAYRRKDDLHVYLRPHAYRLGCVSYITTENGAVVRYGEITWTGTDRVTVNYLDADLHVKSASVPFNMGPDSGMVEIDGVKVAVARLEEFGDEYTEGQELLATEGTVSTAFSKAVPLNPSANVGVELFNEDTENYFKLSINAADCSIVTFDANYNDGAALFDGDAEFRSHAVFKNQADLGSLRTPKPGASGFFSISPAYSAIFNDGIMYTPEYERSNLAADYYLTFPKRTGVIATEDFVAEKIPTDEKFKEIAGEALNTIYDEQLGVTWQARMVDGNLYYIAVTNVNAATIK